MELAFEKAVGIILDSRRPLSSVVPLEVLWDGVRRKAEAVISPYSSSCYINTELYHESPKSIRSTLSDLASHDEEEKTETR